ncbi:MAG: DUF4367 domain-containing protein [Candidatus Limiplasma sp.]|nr:DUF4367 domain-containing protein [Candidatus Limiplasma sp.]
MIKRRNNQSVIEKKTLADRAYDLLGGMIALRDGEMALKKLEADGQTGNTTEILDACFKEYDAKNRAIIDRHFRKQRNIKLLFKTIPKAVQIAVASLGVIFLAGSVAVATNQSFRARVMELLYHVEEEYTTLQLRENQRASFDVPTAWGGDYYPSYLPDGIEIGEVHGAFASFRVEYIISSSGSHYMYFMENGEEAETNIDTEDAKIRPVMIRGNPGLLSIKEGQTTVAWSDSTRYFVLILYGGSEKTALGIANSVIRIEQ